MHAIKNCPCSEITGLFWQRINCIVISRFGKFACFRTTASSFLRLVEDDDDNLSTAHIAKQIVKESKELISSNNVYKTKIDKETAAADVSPTLQSLLSKICKEMNSLPVILMGNMVTSIVTKRPTTLQVALGVLIRSKSLVETLHEFGVTCTYDEMLRFKSSADAAQNSILSGKFQ